MIAQTVLLLLLIVSYPFWERYEIGTLKGSTEPDARVKSYRRTILYQWGVALVLALLVGPRTLARPPAAVAGVSGPTSEFLVTAAPALLAGLLAPVLLAKSNPALRKSGKHRSRPSPTTCPGRGENAPCSRWSVSPRECVRRSSFAAGSSATSPRCRSG